jgi:hypothetical protein
MSRNWETLVFGFIQTIDWLAFSVPDATVDDVIRLDIKGSDPMFLCSVSTAELTRAADALVNDDRTHGARMAP